MAIIGIAKPSSASITGITKPSFQELWSTITTTWASETRTWQETGTLFTGTAKPSTTIIGIAKP